MPSKGLEKQREVNRRSYAKHRLDRIAKVQQYRDEHKDEINSRLTVKRQVNPEKYREANRKWYENNPEKWQEYNKSEKRKLISKKCYERARREHPELLRMYAARRRACILQATPTWLIVDDHICIAEYYRIAVELEKITGEKHEVDHVVPLRGKIVCGLHVPWNLQVLPRSEHSHKVKRYRGSE